MTVPDPLGTDSLGSDPLGPPQAHDPDGDTVDITVPAAVVYVSTLRLAAAALAARCDLTIDEIEDLRLAVDEACALLLPHAPADSPLHAHFDLHQGKLDFTATVRSIDGEPDRSGFAWTVLGALVSSVDVSADGENLTIAITKTREAAAR